MSKKELSQVSVFTELRTRRITQKAAATKLRLTVRQVRRKLRAFRGEGAASLVHKLRGRAGNRHSRVDRRTRALALVEAGRQRQEWKIAAIDTALRELERTKVLIRLARDLQQIQERRMSQWQESTDRIGRMLGGWRKSV